MKKLKKILMIFIKKLWNLLNKHFKKLKTSLSAIHFSQKISKKSFENKKVNGA